MSKIKFIEKLHAAGLLSNQQGTELLNIATKNIADKFAQKPVATQNVEEGDKAYYKVEIHLYKVEETLTYFPLEAVLEEMDKDLEFTCPIPTGETFTPSYPYGKIGASDIMITITGGDKVAYISAIEAAGYNHYEAWDGPDYDAYVNFETHIAIYVYDSNTNTDYNVEYGIAFSY